MRAHGRLAFVVLSLIACSIFSLGCGPIWESWEDANSYSVSAKEIDPDLIGQGQSLTFKDGTKAYVGTVLYDSQKKCEKFVNGLVLSETTVNSGLDMTTTVLSALATAFTPLSTVHALTAGATVASGWRTAINSNIYAKLTIANYAQAIEASYYTDLMRI
jgi:hypothetical protein